MPTKERAAKAAAKKTASHGVTLTLSAGDHAALKAVADANGEKVADLVQRAVEFGLGHAATRPSTAKEDGLVIRAANVGAEFTPPIPVSRSGVGLQTGHYS